jgi:opacity protein-like surface antigen
MRVIGVSLGILLVIAGFARAQEDPPTPRVEIGVDYSLFHANLHDDASQITSNGGSGYFVYNLNRVLGAVADLGGYHNGSIHGPLNGDTTFTYLFGPRFNWRHWRRADPYVQFLFGGARASSSVVVGETTASASHNGFAMAAGGGLDVAITRHLAITPIQVEYLTSQDASFAANRNSFQNGLRYSAGVVLRFGEK